MLERDFIGKEELSSTDLNFGECSASKSHVRYSYLSIPVTCAFEQFSQRFWKDIRKNNVWFSRYLDFCVFGKSTYFKFCDFIIDIAAYWKLHFCLFLLNPKYCQNKISPNTSVSYKKTFLTCFWLNAGDWKLVPGPFMILMK